MPSNVSWDYLNSILETFGSLRGEYLHWARVGEPEKAEHFRQQCNEFLLKVKKEFDKAGLPFQPSYFLTTTDTSSLPTWDGTVYDGTTVYPVPGYELMGWGNGIGGPLVLPESRTEEEPEQIEPYREEIEERVV
jgi:hypothetical protein